MIARDLDMNEYKSYVNADGQTVLVIPSPEVSCKGFNAVTIACDNGFYVPMREHEVTKIAVMGGGSSWTSMPGNNEFVLWEHDFDVTCLSSVRTNFKTYIEFQGIDVFTDKSVRFLLQYAVNAGSWSTLSDVMVSGEKTVFDGVRGLVSDFMICSDHGCCTSEVDVSSNVSTTIGYRIVVQHSLSAGVASNFFANVFIERFS